MSDPTRRSWWLDAALEGLATAASVYVLFRMTLKFGDELIMLPLMIGGVVALLIADGPVRGVLRRMPLFFLLTIGVIASPLAALFEPAFVAPALVGVAALAVTARSASRRRRVLGASLASLGLLSALVGPFGQHLGSAWRLALLYLLFVGLVVAMTARPQRPRRVLAVLVLAVFLAVAPTLGSRNLPCDDGDLAAVAAQPGVEVLFDNSTSLDLPTARMELLCDQKTGIRVVTPHAPAKRLGFLDPDGGTRTLVLYGDASYKSALVDGVLFTGPRGQINAVDVRSGEVRRGPRLMPHTIAYLNAQPSTGRLTMVEDQSKYCHFARLDTLSGAGHMRLKVPGDCLPFGDDLVLLTELVWPGRRVAVLRESDGQVLRENHLPDLGFNQIALDEARGLVFAPATVLGRITVLDLATLAVRETFSTHVGVRNVLVDPAGDRLYAWDYFDGEVVEHALPGGRITRTWRLGKPLRLVNWDCDGEHLLATTCLGGFRIDVSRPAL